MNMQYDRHKKNISILTWNIHGFKRKLTDIEFINNTCVYEIVFLSETWIKERDAFDFNISGYTCEHLYAHKHITQRKGRHSGGITVHYQDYL